MGRIVVTEFVSLDGVTEDPGASESFKHGGWTFEIDRGEGPAREQRVSLRLFFDTPKTRFEREEHHVALLPSSRCHRDPGPRGTRPRQQRVASPW